MSETVNQDIATKETPKTEPRMFTQEEVDRLIGERLFREREKYAGFDTYKEKAEKYDAAEEASKTELQKAQDRAEKLQAQLDGMLKADELRKIREKVSQETGVPVVLLTAEDEEGCKAQAQGILDFSKPARASVPDRGEVRPGPGGSTAKQFEDWFKNNFSK